MTERCCRGDLSGGLITLVTCGGLRSQLKERYYAHSYLHARPRNYLSQRGKLPQNGVDARHTFTLEEEVLQLIGKKRFSEYQNLARNRTIIPCSLLLAFFSLCFSAITTQAQTERRVLRTIHEVNQLTNIEARNAYAVKLEGTVTYSDPEWGLLFVEDSTGAIYVNVHGMNTSYAPGTRVKIEAVTGPGDVDTVLVNPHVEVVGKGEMPTPERRSLADLNAQKADSRFVVTHGALRAGDQPWKRTCFRMFDGENSALVVVPQLSGPEARHLVGSSVRVRGVSAVHIDSKGKVVGSLIFVNRLEDIEVESGTAGANLNTLAVIVNKGNPVNDLPLGDLRRILLGERTIWKGSRKIVVLLPTVGSPERQTTLRLVAMDESSYRNHWAEVSGTGGEAVPVSTAASGMAVNLVADSEDAIAVVPLADVKGSVKILRIDGSMPGDSGYPIH